VISRLSKKQVRLVGLKPNKDLAYINTLFEAGKLRPVIDRLYKLEDLAHAFRRFGSGDYKGKIIITIE
jgi:NADPH:quinone reductase-like Zn-dependent oxidoreductase